MQEVTYDLKAHVWKDKFLNYGFACFRLILKRQTLQWETLEGVVYEHMPFVRLQFT